MSAVSWLISVLTDYWFTEGLVLIALYYLLNGETRHVNVPPGPTGLPFLGYIPFLTGKFSHCDLLTLGKKYGSVFSLKLGLNNVIIVNDFANAVDALNNEALQDRPAVNIFNAFAASTNDGGMTSWSGQLWKEHRRFTLRALRTLGVGRQEIENLVMEEISFLLSRIEKCSAERTPIKIRDLLGPSSSNVVHSVILGKRLDYEDPMRKTLTSVFTGFTASPLPFTGYFIQFIALFGWLWRHQLTLSKQARKISENDMILQNYMDDETDEHIKNFDEHNPKDFIDLYIAECKSSQNSHFNVKHASSLALDMFGAGSATTRDALEWILLCLALYPSVQEKVVKEISDVIGFERKPTYGDRQLMPYLQAVIMETHRKSSMIPLNLQHCASEDTMIGDYVVVKGSQLLVNFWAIHHDPAYWTEPEKFDPSRFLDENGTKIIKRDSFMPFSYGRRSCPGEPLAQMELFAFIASVVQKFKISCPNNALVTDEGTMSGFAHAPKRAELVFDQREVNC